MQGQTEERYASHTGHEGCAEGDRGEGHVGGSWSPWKLCSEPSTGDSEYVIERRLGILAALGDGGRYGTKLDGGGEPVDDDGDGGGGVPGAGAVEDAERQK